MNNNNMPNISPAEAVALDENLLRLHTGNYHDPFEFLGIHRNAQGQTFIRLLLPAAEKVDIDGLGSMARIPGTDFFTYLLKDSETIAPHFGYRWLEKGSDRWQQSISPYTFLPQIADYDLQLFAAGNHHHAYRFLGAHLKHIDGINGCLFSVWAPNVQRISVVGNFNGWDGRHNPMRSLGASGIWELFIPDLSADEHYKYEILSEDGRRLLKTDPYAQAMAVRPDTTSRIVPNTDFIWRDSDWIAARQCLEWQHQPISIYELHVGSWRRDAEQGFMNWRDIAEQLIPYVQELGYTHIELLPIAEHPLDQSWGYQVTGFFAPTSRFGSPDDFRYFIDQCHQHNIGVFLDWVPAHFPKDDFALARFNGGTLYEHADPRRGEHQDWGTLIFDYGRNEVRNFLITNAVFWIEEFHIDGLRVDAVASMLYLDYSREPGEWAPNVYGGRENLEAIDFLRKMNATLHGLHPGVLTMAEESTAWPMVSRPIELGGLGFSMKWNMGWMNDNLSYIEHDPVYRQYHHDKLTFSQMYSYSENFVLPLSHDEVVHEKRSLLNKMPGDLFQKFANLRLFYAWQYAHPGKKLLFMGGEIAQWQEWNDNDQLDWAVLDEQNHQGVKQLVSDLNRLYRDEPALHYWDFSQDGFEWIDCHDSSQSVISMVRKGPFADASMICVMNFTPVVRQGYRLGVPDADSYREVLNTDSHYYAGSNCGNAGEIVVDNIAWGDYKQSLALCLPPLAGIFLKGFVHE